MSSVCTPRILDYSQPASVQVFGHESVSMHCVCTEPDVGHLGVGPYGARGILALGGQQVAVLRSDAEESVRAVLDLAEESGLSRIPSHQLVSIEVGRHQGLYQAIVEDPRQLKELQSYEGWNLAPFAINRDVVQVAHQAQLQLPASYEAAEFVNNKGSMLQYLSEHGVPTTTGTMVYSPDELRSSVERLWEAGWEKVAIKVPRSAAGQGVFPVTNEEELQAVLCDTVFAQTVFEDSYPFNPRQISGARVEGWVGSHQDAKGRVWRPAINCGITPEGEVIVLGEPTMQILSADETEHEGNRTMEAGELPLDVMTTMKTLGHQSARLAYCKGYTGILGIDVCVLQREDTGKFECFVVDPNARPTGQTHGLFLMHDLHQEAMATGNVHVPEGTTIHEVISFMQRSHISYTARRDVGLILCNAHTLESTPPKLQVVAVAQTPQAAKEYFEELGHHFSPHSYGHSSTHP